MEYQDLRDQFLEKFGEDERIMDEKLHSIGLAKNTYLDIKYQRRQPTKKTIETIRAYVENRRPKFEAVDPKINFYCCFCEEVMPLIKQHDRWACRPCDNA